MSYGLSNQVFDRRAVAVLPVDLQVHATASHYTFLGGAEGGLEPLGTLPTTALSAETIMKRTGRHHFTGAMIGLFATGNGKPSTVPADFDWLEYVPDPARPGSS